MLAELNYQTAPHHTSWQMVWERRYDGLRSDAVRREPTDFSSMTLGFFFCLADVGTTPLKRLGQRLFEECAYPRLLIWTVTTLWFHRMHCREILDDIDVAGPESWDPAEHELRMDGTINKLKGTRPPRRSSQCDSNSLDLLEHVHLFNNH